MNNATAAPSPIPLSSGGAPYRPSLDTSRYRLESDLLEQCRTIDALLYAAAELEASGGPSLNAEAGRGLIAYYKAIADTMVRL